MDLEPNVTQVVLAGQNGRAKICFNVLYEDGVEKQRNRANYTILSQPINQIVAVGVDRSRIEPRTINGTIVYTSGGQARAISEYSLNQTALNTGGRLDGKVFALSENGRQLLFTRKSDDPELYNELWVLLDTANPEAEPVHLEALDNILSAEWVPGQPFTFTYSTLQPREGVPDYQALNDLFTARLDSTTGAILRTDAIVRVGPTGVYATYGTDFKWSPNGAQLAWAQPDGVGLVDLEEGTFTKLFDFRVYTTTLSRNWVWKPDLAWSADGSILSATVHGEPLNPGEERETSPVFDVAAMRIDGAFRIMELLGRTGMWAAPQFSPNGSAIAYLQARRPLDSVTSEYDLMIADRDGSNARAIFPGTTSAGIVPFNITGELFVWSPDGSEIAIVYGGDLYIIDIASGRATQVTLVGDAAHPRWVR
jgi:resuscitation-promoting factor RpfB